MLSRWRRAAAVLAALAAATFVVGVATTQLPARHSTVKVLAADAGTTGVTPAPTPTAPESLVAPPTVDSSLLVSRPPSAPQECPSDATEPSMGNGYCGPEPRAGNGEGPGGLCTGNEPGPPCGPGVEPGRWYAYTLAISCDAHTIFNGQRWISTLGPPPAEEAPRHVWITLYPSGDAGVLSPTMAVGYKADARGPMTNCPPPPTP